MDDATVVHRDHAVGHRQAALEPVLGQQDRRLPLLVEPPQQPDQLVAGNRVELRGGLVEQNHRRPARKRGAERDALLLASRELVHGAVEQRVDPERQRHLLHSPRGRGRRLSAALERERELGPHGACHQLRLGVLEQRADHCAEARRRMRARVEASDPHGAGEASAVKMGNKAAGRAQERRLALTGEPRQQAQFAGLELEADIGERRLSRAGVAVRHALEGEDRTHGSIPRRSANGSRTATSSATHSAGVPAVIGAWTRGYA